MRAKPQTGFKNIAGVFDISSKMVAAFISMVVVVYTVSVFFYKLNETINKVEQYNKDVTQMYKEAQKDWQAKYDDQHDLIIKNMQAIAAVKQAFNDHEISAAEFRGRVKQILGIP